MSNNVIAFLVSVGAAGWVYSKMIRRTGGNTQSALIVAAISGVMLFIFVLFALSFVPN